MTLLEVSVVVAMVMVMAIVTLAIHVRTDYSKQAQNIDCVNNLKQIGLASRVWAGNHDDVLPAGVPVIKGGAMEMIRTGGVVQAFLVMSNELSTPAIFLCPSDRERSYAWTLGSLSSSNVSYFFGADATNDLNPALMFSGDSDFEIGGQPVKPGLLSLGTNAPVSWQPVRHGMSGNVCFVDGSVQSVTPLELRKDFVQTGQATNRLAIP